MYVGANQSVIYIYMYLYNLQTQEMSLNRKFCDRNLQWKLFFISVLEAAQNITYTFILIKQF